MITTIALDNANHDFIKAIGLGISQLPMLDRMVPYKELIKLADWQKMIDIDILFFINYKQLIASTLYVVTDISFIEKIVFKTTVDTLHQLMEQYVHIYRECFFNGDVFILAIESQKIIQFHHEGCWFLYDIKTLIKKSKLI